MKILELKNTVAKMKYSIDELYSRFQMNEKRIIELEDESIVYPVWRTERKKFEGKLNGASETWEPPPIISTYV